MRTFAILAVILVMIVIGYALLDVPTPETFWEGVRHILGGSIILIAGQQYRRLDQ